METMDLLAANSAALAAYSSLDAAIQDALAVLEAYGHTTITLCSRTVVPVAAAYKGLGITKTSTVITTVGTSLHMKKYNEAIRRGDKVEFDDIPMDIKPNRDCVGRNLVYNDKTNNLLLKTFGGLNAFGGNAIKIVYQDKDGNVLSKDKVEQYQTDSQKKSYGGSYTPDYECQKSYREYGCKNIIGIKVGGQVFGQIL